MDPTTCAKKPSKADGWAEANGGGGVPHAHAHTYKLINVKQDKSHVEQIGASKHISSLGGRERVVR